jgi:hypothetical protein
LANCDKTKPYDEGPVLEPLNGSPGPAIPLTGPQTELLAGKIAKRALQKQKGGFVFFRAAAAIWLAVGLCGTALASVAAYFVLYPPVKPPAENESGVVREQRSTVRSAARASDEPADVPVRQPSLSLVDETLQNDASRERADKGGAVEDAAAGDLLVQANRFRAEHRWRAAERLYTRVYRGHPAVLQARSAMVAAASLRLEHLNDARGALRLYQRVLRETAASGDLAEEALWGIAEAHRVLSNSAAETKTLERFLSIYPNSVLAPRARKRLAAMRSIL